jgi:hypothetical protein
MVGDWVIGEGELIGWECEGIGIKTGKFWGLKGRNIEV